RKEFRNGYVFRLHRVAAFFARLQEAQEPLSRQNPRRSPVSFPVLVGKLARLPAESAARRRLEKPERADPSRERRCLHPANELWRSSTWRRPVPPAWT